MIPEHAINVISFTMTAGIYRLTTEQLVKIFGIPTGEHLVIHNVGLSDTAAAANMRLSWDIDPKQNVAKLVEAEGGALEYSDHTLRLSCVTDTVFITPDMVIPVRDNLIIEKTSGSSATYIDIYYNTMDGGMYWLDEVADSLGDITQVSRQTHIGGIYHQLGDKKKVAGGG